jgi:hypothetical protein
MKRDPRLHGLSSDHHHALALARELSRTRWTAEAGAALQRRFAAELEPHFRVEEEVLLPALRDVGCTDLVERILEDHRALRALVAVGDEPAALSFGLRLQEHVRFEELELFPACEARLPAQVLDEVARRVPGPRQR